MVINLPFDTSFTLSRHELAKGILTYLIIHSLFLLYRNLNKVIKWLVSVERRRVEKQLRTRIIKRHVFDSHPYRLKDCLVGECAMLTSSDI